LKRATWRYRYLPTYHLPPTTCHLLPTTMASRKNNDLPLKDVIRIMLERSGMDKKYNELEIIDVYHKVVGNVISKRTIDVKIRDRTLILKIDTGVVKAELSLSKTKLKDLINESFGTIVVEEIEIW